MSVLQKIAGAPLRYKILFAVQTVFFGGCIAIRISDINRARALAAESSQQQPQLTTADNKNSMNIGSSDAGIPTK
jgi:hypothetical protein